MRSRIVTALVLGGVATAIVLWLPTWALALVLGLVWLAGAHEWTRLAVDARIPPLVYVAAVGILMLVSGALLDSMGAMLVAYAAAAWWAVALALLWLYPRGLTPAIVAVAGPLTLIPSWLLICHVHGLGPQGPALALSLFAIVWAADVGAYLVGRRIGRVKLAPLVSPGKTWEGVAGGAVSAALAASVAAVVLRAEIVSFVLVAVAAMLVSVIGDLTVSMFKRNVGVKDSGQVLPGHGGILDRIDSLSAAAPFFFLGLHLAGLQI
ncbi:MAG TPA: phosphatidate cytidylyltransferase [Gammaproteobacteria bacterium]